MIYSKIDTPQLFEQLKAEEFSVNPEDHYIITSGAHENVLSQPKHFADSKYTSLTFKSDDTSYITIKPKDKLVNAFFFGGYQFTLGMPADYTGYYMGFLKDVEVGIEDVDYIFHWTSAKKLYIFGENVVAFKLQQRLAKLRELKHLEDIYFDVSYKTYMKLRVKPFVDALHSLKTFYFRALEITEGQFDMFVKSQTVPVGWKCVVVDKVEYHCKKN